MSKVSTLERRLGRTEIEVFPLGFGGIPIQRISMREAVEVVRRAIEVGINFIDTARAYTDSEKKIGIAIEGIDKRLYLASKTKADKKKEALDDVDKSLTKLGVGTIDLFQLHNVSDDETLDRRLGKDGALAGLKQAQNEGKIKYIGITGHRNETLVKAIKIGIFDTVLFCYNFIETECETELIETARELDIGMIAMKPLAGGRLRNTKVALKYLLNQEGVVPIPGMETVDEVNENVGIAKGSWELTPEEKNTQEKLKEELGTVFCRRCGYCQPCPEEVLIPMVLRAESFINRMNPKELKEGRFRKALLSVGNCVACGECIERCPYDLPIPELIEKTKRIIDDYYSSLE